MQSYTNEDKDVNKLERALTTFLRPGGHAGLLARVLVQACKTGMVSYDEVEEIAKDDSADVLLLGFELRLLLPTRSARGTLEWGDAVLLPKPGEMYKMPNVVECLVEEASRTGRWDPDNAVAKVFMLMGESEWHEMPKLVQKLSEEGENRMVNAIQIKRVCGELDLEDRVDILIAELKGSGVVSPRVSSLIQVIKEGSPIYELNPSLSVSRRGKGS
jgi:hypothetical protein